MSDNLKEFLKQHIDAHESPVDPNEIWEGIKQKRQRPKKRGIYLFIPLLMLLSIAGLLYLNKSELSLDTSMHAQTYQSTEQSAIENIIEDRSQNNNEISEVAVEFENTTPNNKSNPISRNLRKEISSQVPSSTFTRTFSAPFQSPINNTFQLFSSSQKIEEPLLKQKVNEQFNSQLLLKKPTINITPILPIRPRTLELLRESVINLENKIIPIKKKKRKPLLGIELAAGMVSKNLHSIDPSLVSLSEDKQTFENPLDLYSLRLLLDIPVINNFSLGLGLSYTRINEQFNWSGTFMRNEKGDILAIESYDAEGTPLFNYTSGVYFEEVDQNINHYNQYNLVDIPVSISYHHSLFNRLGLDLSAGLNINVSESFDGYLFTEDNVPTALEDRNEYISFSTAPYLKAGLSIPVLNRASLNMGAEYNMRRMNERTSSWTYSSMGGYLGLYFNL